MIIWPDICECVAVTSMRGQEFVVGYEGGNGWYIAGSNFLDQNWGISDEGWQGFYEELRGIPENQILMRKGLMRW